MTSVGMNCSFFGQNRLFCVPMYVQMIMACEHESSNNIICQTLISVGSSVRQFAKYR